MCGDFGMAPVGAAGMLAVIGRVRLRRHHPLGLAVRPLRQSLAAVLVLRPARPLADLAALHRLLARRPVAVRRVLRPGLDRDRAADGQADRRPLRPPSAPTSSSAGSSPATSSAPPPRPTAPGPRAHACSPPTCPPSTPPASSAWSRRYWHRPWRDPRCSLPNLPELAILAECLSCPPPIPSSSSQPRARPSAASRASWRVWPPPLWARTRSARQSIGRHWRRSASTRC